MRRVGQLQAAKFSGMLGKSMKYKDFPRQSGLDAPELPAEHRLIKVAKQLGQSVSLESLLMNRHR